MDFDLIARELLKTLRGKQSQQTLNRKLGHDYNWISRRELGSRPIYWDDFLKVAEMCRTPLDRTFSRILGFSISDLSEISLVESLLELPNKGPLSKLSASQKSRIRNLKYGRSRLKLSDVLLLLDINGEMIPVLMNIVFKGSGGDRENGFWSELFQESSAIKDLIFRDPMVEALLAGMGSSKAVSTTELTQLSKQLSLSEKRRNNGLAQLSFLGLIKKTQDSRYEVVRSQVNTGGAGVEDYLKGLKIKEFWMKKALSILKKRFIQPNVALFGYELISVSDPAHKEIKKIIARTFREIREVVAKDNNKKKKTLKLVQLNLLNLDDTYSE